ncbi:AraC family transcriptional regulator [Paenibacillus peoriae]|uniref:helix-turn-helix transcriptional regulator n=1 Tax=Paenibacillus peoriae TaxID=59893 RepID=UPI000CEBEEDC|nr:helix-turn-helix transcriptional regulator [Paenibacillus peoriae]PPQ48591.1 AraC family transcriptional regulator [Paenibacillus peoriae]
MSKTDFLSFLVPPLPYFIEGNFTTYQKGDWHPNRYNLGYFDVIIIKEGLLHIGEEDEVWKVTENYALILEPDKHHFPIEACTEQTSFYWFHFQTNSMWCAQSSPNPIIPSTPIPELHFHSEHTTIHLPKIQKVVNPHELFSKLDYLLASTLKPRKLALWEAQQTFVNVFQSLEYDQNNKDSSSKLAEQVELYLKQNYKNTITNKDLETHFHVHQNYLARCMKVAFQRTPLEYLMDYRLDQGRSLLLQTDWSVQQITEETGFSQASYFSKCFKEKFGMSPKNYRQQYWKPVH